MRALNALVVDIKQKLGGAVVGVSSPPTSEILIDINKPRW